MENNNGLDGYAIQGRNAKSKGYKSIFILNKKYIDFYADSTKEQMKAYYSAFDKEYLKAERIMWQAMGNVTICNAIDELLEKMPLMVPEPSMDSLSMKIIAEKAYCEGSFLTVYTKEVRFGYPHPAVYPSYVVSGRVHQVTDKFVYLDSPPKNTGEPWRSNVLQYFFIDYLEIKKING